MKYNPGQGLTGLMFKADFKINGLPPQAEIANKLKYKFDVIEHQGYKLQDGGTISFLKLENDEVYIKVGEDYTFIHPLIHNNMRKCIWLYVEGIGLNNIEQHIEDINKGINVCLNFGRTKIHPTLKERIINPYLCRVPEIVDSKDKVQDEIHNWWRSN